jgi:hypothetical protein
LPIFVICVLKLASNDAGRTTGCSSRMRDIGTVIGSSGSLYDAPTDISQMGVCLLPIKGRIARHWPSWKAASASGTARLEEAVNAYRTALWFRTEKDAPAQWAALNNAVGELQTLIEARRMAR